MAIENFQHKSTSMVQAADHVQEHDFLIQNLNNCVKEYFNTVPFKEKQLSRDPRMISTHWICITSWQIRNSSPKVLLRCETFVPCCKASCDACKLDHRHDITLRIIEDLYGASVHNCFAIKSEGSNSSTLVVDKGLSNFDLEDLSSSDVSDSTINDLSKISKAINRTLGCANTNEIPINKFILGSESFFKTLSKVYGL